MSESIELCEEELDIVGDCEENEDTSDVTIHCKGTLVCVFSVFSDMFLCNVLSFCIQIASSVHYDDDVVVPIVIIFVPWYFIPRVLKLANAKIYDRNCYDGDSKTVNCVPIIRM